jgi:hypothetical protein
MDAYRALIERVDDEFAVTGRAHAPWDDPHPDRSPTDEEYSRVLDPAKWRIIGARADAWIRALVDGGIADVEHDAEPRWLEPPGADVSRTDRIVPRRAGTISLLVGRSRIGSVDGAGVTIGAGDPATSLTLIPDCGCDACDSGSRAVIDELDEWIGGVVRGELRHLTRRVARPPRPAGFRFVPAAARDAHESILSSPTPLEATWALPELETITVISTGRWAASGSFRRGAVEAALADPSGWDELTGAPWIGP